MREECGQQWSIASDERGCSFLVKVSAGAKRNFAGGIHQGALKVSVTQIAEKGKANREVLKVLCGAIGVRGGQLSIVSGETSRLKKIYCSQITVEELRQKLDRLI